MLKTQEATQPVLQNVNVWITWTMSTPAEFSSAAAYSLVGLKRFNQAGCLLALDTFLALQNKEGQRVKKEIGKGY